MRQSREDRVEEAFRKHGRRILHFCYVRLGVLAEAEDVTAETFARLQGHIDRVADRAVLAWLFRAAANLCIDIHRRSLRLTSLDESEWDRLPDVRQDGMSSDALAVFEVMRTLSPQDQQVLYLRAVEDLPFSEVGRLLRISEAAAKMRFRRAGRVLEAKLGKGESCRRSAGT